MVEHIMSEEERRKKNDVNIRWRKRQRILTVTLNPIMDRDIIEFLDSTETPNATLTKQIIRAYMAMQSVGKSK